MHLLTFLVSQLLLHILTLLCLLTNVKTTAKKQIFQTWLCTIKMHINCNRPTMQHNLWSPFSASVLHNMHVDSSAPSNHHTRWPSCHLMALQVKCLPIMRRNTYIWKLPLNKDFDVQVVHCLRWVLLWSSHF